MNLCTSKIGPHLSAGHCPFKGLISDGHPVNFRCKQQPFLSRYSRDMSELHGKGIPGEAKLHHLGKPMVCDNETYARIRQ